MRRYLIAFLALCITSACYADPEIIYIKKKPVAAGDNTVDLNETFASTLGAFSQAQGTVTLATVDGQAVMNVSDVTFGRAVASFYRARGFYIQWVAKGGSVGTGTPSGSEAHSAKLVVSNHATTWNSDSYHIEIRGWDQDGETNYGTDILLFKNGTTQIGSTYTGDPDAAWILRTYRLELAAGGGITLKLDGATIITGTDNTTTEFQKAHAITKGAGDTVVDSVVTGGL